MCVAVGAWGIFFFYVRLRCMSASAEVRDTLLDTLYSASGCMRPLRFFHFSFHAVRVTSHAPIISSARKKRKVFFFPPYTWRPWEQALFLFPSSAHWLAAHFWEIAWAKWCFPPFSIGADNEMHTGLWLRSVAEPSLFFTTFFYSGVGFFFFLLENFPTDEMADAPSDSAALCKVKLIAQSNTSGGANGKTWL